MRSISAVPRPPTTPPAGVTAGWRVLGTLSAGLALSVLLLAYDVFWAAPYDAYQDAVVVVVTLLVLLALQGAIWAGWPPDPTGERRGPATA